MSDDTTRDPLLDELGREARTLKQARILPAGPLSAEQISAIRSDYARYTSREGLFDPQVSREVGVDAAELGRFRNGLFKGDAEKLARALNDWMEQHARRQQAALPEGYVTTGIAEELRAIVSLACATVSMAAIVAPSGSGKSMVLEILCEKYRGRMIYCTPYLTGRSLLQAIAGAIDAPRAGTRAELMHRIIERLRGTGRPLFFDEVQSLREDSLPCLRSIFDQAGVPIIMAGTAEILERINDRFDGRGQLASRCLQYNCLDGAMDVDRPGGGGGGRSGRPLFSREEVRAFLTNLHVRFDPDAGEIMWAIACLPNHGCLRTVRRIVLTLRPSQASREKVITRADVLMALRLMFGQVGTLIGQGATRHLELARSIAV